MPGLVEPNFNIPWSDSQVPFSGTLARAAQGMPAVNGGDGTFAPVMVDKIGRVVTTGNNIRTLCLTGYIATATTTATVFSPAPITGTFQDLSGLFITTNGTTSATLTISDGSKTVMVVHYPNASSAPSVPFAVDFTPPLSQSISATSWTLQASSSANTYFVTSQFVEGV